MGKAKRASADNAGSNGTMTMRGTLQCLAALLSSIVFMMQAPPSRSAAESALTAAGPGKVQSAPGDAKPAKSAAEAAGPKITFRRIFKSSVPEFIEIVVHQDSDAGTYEIRQLDDEPGSLPFEVGPELRAKIFALAAQLNHFQGLDLDVHRRIANLGEKTLIWQDGSEVHETKFNYTLNGPASQLMQIFEGLARQEGHVATLTRRMRYDRLGINDALLQVESDYNHGLLPEPTRLLPVLDQIAADSRFVDIARQRARSLAERIRNGNPRH